MSISTQRKLSKITISTVALTALMVTSFSSTALAVTQRTAKVIVENDTGESLVNVTVSHKYSDVYKNLLEWEGILKPGGKTSPKTVEYNTGFGTTGRDWWAISWGQVGSDQIYYSNPNNFRGFMDGLEQVGTVALPVVASTIAAVVGVVCTGATAGGCGGPAVAGTAAAAAGASALGAMMMNSEETKGFKQHILRSEDENKIVTITLKKNSEILISSPSGKSETVYSSKINPLSAQEKQKIEDLANAEIQKTTGAMTGGKTGAVEAGPIWNQADANEKCPKLAAQNNGSWTGGWWTTVQGKMSVCEIK